MAEKDFEILFEYMGEEIKKNPALADRNLNNAIASSREVMDLIEIINAVKPPPRMPLLFTGT